MAILSAGIKVSEYDLSEYVVVLGQTRPCFIGGASKGALNTPTEVNTEPELYDKFGPPLLNDYGLQAAAQYLRKGNRLTYMRVATSAAAVAKKDVSGTSGGTPAVAATGSVSFTVSTNPADAETVTLHDTVPWVNLENDANGALGNVAITVPVGGARIAVSGMSGGDVTHRATGWVKGTNSAMPLAGDQIVISDGVTSVIFEFATVDPAPNAWVDITGVTDPYEAYRRLVTAINAAIFNVSSVNYADTKQYRFEFDNNATWTPGNLPVLIGATAAATLANLITAVNNSAADVVAVDGTVTVPQMDLTQSTGGTDGNAAIQEAGAQIGVVGFSGGVNAIPGAPTTLFTLFAKSPGTWGDDVQVVISDSTAIGAPADAFDIVIYAPVDQTGLLQPVERFTNLVLDSTSERYLEKVVEEGLVGEISPSAYIDVTVLADGDPTNGTYQLGDIPGNEGNDGISGLASSDYIGTISGTTATGLQAIKNAEAVEFNILAVPGVSHQAVVAEMIATAESRADCICLVDTPIGLDRDEVLDWHNGLSAYPDAPLAALDSSYATLTWAWVKVYDAWNKQYVWLPPSGFVAAQFAYTDRVAAPWFPAAGHNRGMISGLEVEYSPSQTDRDLMCPIFTGDNRVNPIVNFAADGLVLYGNRTLQRKWSMLTDVHVRRLLLHAEKLCATSAKYLVFEPNDPITWKKYETMCNRHLSEIAAARGLDRFEVQCNSTTNTAFYLSTRRMRAKLFVLPRGAAEGIEIDFSIFATGAEFTE